MDTFRAALWHVKYHVDRLEQDELNLAGVGEPTLHPLLPDFVQIARETVGKGVFLNITTNGIDLDEDLVLKLKPYLSAQHGHQPGVFVSLHRPERAKRAVDLCRKHSMLAGVSNDPALASIDWAGQIPDFEVTAPNDRPCPWLRLGRAFVFSNGQVGTCCMPAELDGVIGHVNDKPGTLFSKPYRLCASCDQVVGIKGYQQYPTGQKLAKPLPRA